MEDLFQVIEVETLERVGNLMAEAHSQVKSTKFFPTYRKEDKTMIFKPLSKSKPLTTPLFAYSEVYWSYVIKNYFDPNTPQYVLATSTTIEQEQPKYYPQGVLVESITKENESLQNLYDYFTEHPDPIVDIKNYINYCMMQYDYTSILLSHLFLNNQSLGKDLAYQILLSILRQDQNFHYENINFLWKDDQMTLAPPIDFEFSTPFLYPDNKEKRIQAQQNYQFGTQIPEDHERKVLSIFYNRTINKNIRLIVQLYPDIVQRFIHNLEQFQREFSQIRLQDNYDFLKPWNSDSWLIGDAFYKEKDFQQAKILQEKIKPIPFDKQTILTQISTDIKSWNEELLFVLKAYLYARKKDFHLEDLTLQQLLNTIEKEENQETQTVAFTKELKKRGCSEIK